MHTPLEHTHKLVWGSIQVQSNTATVGRSDITQFISTKGLIRHNYINIKGTCSTQ